VGTRSHLQRLGLAPRKSLGQNFLTDPRAAQAIVSAASIQPGDAVIEVGPGLGALTGLLCQHASRVLAVEVDSGLAAELRATLGAHHNLTILQADILQVDLAQAVSQACGVERPPVRMVSNLPYYITSAVLRLFLESAIDLRAMVVTVQLEVAQRITAGPGDMSLLSVGVQYYGRPEIVMRLSPSAFYPQPDVESAVVRITPHLPPTGHNRSVFILAKSGFSQRRKQLRNTLASGLSIPKTAAEDLLEEASIDPSRRAESLSITEWARLASVYDITFKDKKD
jgi:16S rRNA (adenine1518-N6/adenine1519-N6)-dimethyltransferase